MLNFLYASGVKGSLKEAFINVSQIFSESSQGKILQEKIMKKAQELRLELDKKSNDLQQLKADFGKKAATMSDDARRKEEKRIMQLERDFSALANEQQEEFEISGKNMQRAWEVEFQQFVTEWAEMNDFDIVWDEITGQLLYARSSLKHTNDFLLFINKKGDAKKSVKQVIPQKS